MNALSRIALTALLAAGLTACETGTFTTRGAITLDGSKVLLCNQWGALPCIGSEMDKRDAWVIIEAMKAKMLADAQAKR